MAHPRILRPTLPLWTQHVPHYIPPKLIPKKPQKTLQAGCLCWRGSWPIRAASVPNVGDGPDLFHTMFSVASLALLGHPDVLPIDPLVCLPVGLAPARR